MILVDVFMHDDMMVMWCKEGRTDRFISWPFNPVIHVWTFNEPFVRSIFAQQRIETVRLRDMRRGVIDVLRITYASPGSFDRHFRGQERRIARVATIYDADIPLEDMFMHQHGIFPLARITIDGENGITCHDDPTAIDYAVPDLTVGEFSYHGHDVSIDGERIHTMDTVRARFMELDPDIILIDGEPSHVLVAMHRAGIRLNRMGDDPSSKGEGYTFHSYGVQHYRQAPVHLKGRLCINRSNLYSDMTIHSVLEGARICRTPIQRVANRSYGAVVTSLLVHEAKKRSYLIPYTNSVYEHIKPFRSLMHHDRGALILDPEVGLHTDVAELDFVSMFPSIIRRYNLSPETYGCRCCPHVPGSDYRFCQKEEGIVPVVCDILIRRRNKLKLRDDAISKARVAYLKWLLVVIFGYQAFEHTKIGSIEVHEAINAIARETLLTTIHTAERHGFSVVHGIVDSIYVRKSPLRKEELNMLVHDISAATGLTIELKDTFRFMVFLPSAQEHWMPSPTAHYGISHAGTMKVRGIELRQRGVPPIARRMQEDIIEAIADELDSDSLSQALSSAGRVLRRYADAIGHATPEELTISKRLGREEYRVKPAHARVGTGRVGEDVSYIVSDKGCVAAERFVGRPAVEYYRTMLERAAARLFLPFGITADRMHEILQGQTQLSAFDRPLIAPLIHTSDSRKLRDE